MQFFDALRFNWAHGQRCCSVAELCRYCAAYRLLNRRAVGLKTCFLFAFWMFPKNAFSVEEYWEPSTAAVKTALGPNSARFSHLQEQIKSANYTIGRRIDHQSTPSLLRDE